MRFVNHQDLARTIMAQRRKLPAQIDLVVGVPRSGMLPATMLATQLNLPLTDVDGLFDNRAFRHGTTKRAPNLQRVSAEDRVVLIVDDVIGSGKAFRDLRAEVAARGVPGKTIYCSVYGGVRKHPDADVILQAFDETLVFPWNIMHHKVLAEACVDIDGVICPNPEGHECFEGRAYEQFLGNAHSLHGTSGKIGWLVTSRLEKHRQATVAWLAKNQVYYDQLIMASDEEKLDSPAYKARVYRETGASIFIESELFDASRIAALSGRPVICVETLTMIYPDKPGLPRPLPLPLTAPESLSWRHRKAKIKLSLRSAFGNERYLALKEKYRKLKPLKESHEIR